MPLDRRKITKIHTIRKSIGMDDDTYHDLLESLFGVRSCKGLTVAQYLGLLKEFEAKGAAPKKGRKGGAGYPGRPGNMDDEYRGLLLRKIEALLTDMGLPWSYADGIARKVCRVEKVQWCRPPELGKVIAALSYHQQRHPERRRRGTP